MEEMDIKKLWQTYDEKLERTLQLNYKIIRDIQSQKLEGSLTSFRRNQIFGVVAGILWIMLLVFLMVHALNNIYVVLSVGGIALFNIFAVAAYIRHLALLNQVDITESVTTAQQRLASIQSSLNMVGRVLILQTPLYCTFWYNQSLVQHGNAAFWVINLTIVVFLTAVSVYLFRTLTYKNIQKRWVRAFIDGFGGRQLIKAMEFLNEVEAYQKEETR